MLEQQRNMTDSQIEKVKSKDPLNETDSRMQSKTKIIDPNQFVVFKKGKPVTMFNKDKSLKMTRESYFSIAQKQEENKMLDTLSSIITKKVSDGT